MGARRLALPLLGPVMAVIALLGAACGSTARPSGSALPSTGARPGDAAAPAAPAGATSLTLQSDRPYQPAPPPGGGNDIYHCTLVDPHLTTDSMIVASHFFPESPEVHHAILFLVPPEAVAAARAADGNGGGWTCFGESVLPGADPGRLARTPWLSAWAPGHGMDVLPSGTGISFPAGSLVVMQIHYNLLAGHAPVRSRLQLWTRPVSAGLQPLRLSLLPAPPDIPCPSGVSGPLCDRAASLADLGQRFGPELPRFVTAIETTCGRDPANPPAGDSTSCTWPLGFTGQIRTLTAHMHLLGKSMTIVLDPGTPRQRTLLDVPNFNFDYQRSYQLARPVTVQPGDHLQVTCTYNPRLHELLPELRTLPPRFVTWGDGSTDEMCLAIVAWTRGG